MSPQELRWLDNAKKAFNESDLAFQSEQAKDKCFESICKAVDVCKTLRRSLMDLPADANGHKNAYVEFLQLEVPSPAERGLQLALKHARKSKLNEYDLGSLLYEIRCMIHENENLCESEMPDFHILIRWHKTESKVLAWVEDERAVLNGPMLWSRVRQILCKFLSYIDSVYNLPKTGRFHCAIDIPLGGIRPGEPIEPQGR